MLAKLESQIKLCYRRADLYRRRAENPEATHTQRQEFLDMEQHWLNLAKSYELAAQVSSQLEWVAGRRPDSIFDSL